MASDYDIYTALNPLISYWTGTEAAKYIMTVNAVADSTTLFERDQPDYGGLVSDLKEPGANVPAIIAAAKMTPDMANWIANEFEGDLVHLFANDPLAVRTMNIDESQDDVLSYLTGETIEEGEDAHILSHTDSFWQVGWFFLFQASTARLVAPGGRIGKNKAELTAFLKEEDPAYKYGDNERQFDFPDDAPFLLIHEFIPNVGIRQWLGRFESEAAFYGFMTGESPGKITYEMLGESEVPYWIPFSGDNESVIGLFNMDEEAGAHSVSKENDFYVYGIDCPDPMAIWVQRGMLDQEARPPYEEYVVPDYYSSLMSGSVCGGGRAKDSDFMAAGTDVFYEYGGSVLQRSRPAFGVPVVRGMRAYENVLTCQEIFDAIPDLSDYEVADHADLNIYAQALSALDYCYDIPCSYYFGKATAQPDEEWVEANEDRIVDMRDMPSCFPSGFDLPDLPTVPDTITYEVTGDPDEYDFSGPIDGWEPGWPGGGGGTQPGQNCPCALYQASPRIQNVQISSNLDLSGLGASAKKYVSVQLWGSHRFSSWDLKPLHRNNEYWAGECISVDFIDPVPSQSPWLGNRLPGGINYGCYYGVSMVFELEEQQSATEAPYGIYKTTLSFDVEVCGRDVTFYFNCTHNWGQREYLASNFYIASDTFTQVKYQKYVDFTKWSGESPAAGSAVEYGTNAPASCSWEFPSPFPEGSGGFLVQVKLGGISVIGYPLKFNYDHYVNGRPYIGTKGFIYRGLELTLQGSPDNLPTWDLGVVNPAVSLPDGLVWQYGSAANKSPMDEYPNWMLVFASGNWYGPNDFTQTGRWGLERYFRMGKTLFVAEARYTLIEELQEYGGFDN